jgi:GR25 family glycosyltransferase involved in LPS biosynthesis
MNRKIIINTILFIILIIIICYKYKLFYQKIINLFTGNISYTPTVIKNNYIINLDRRTDRWDEFNLKINKTSFSKEPIERFSAFDGSKYLNEFIRFNIEDHKLIKKLKEIKLIVPKGIFGCMMSHLLILEKIRNNTNYDENDYIGIFEEDIIFSNNFEENYNKFKKIDLNKLDVELLYLGGRFASDYTFNNNSLEMYKPTSDPNIYYRNNYNPKKEGDWCRCTFSYVVKKAVCSKLIDIIINTFPTPKYRDSFKPIDHIYTDSYKEIKTFDFFPHLFYSHLNNNTDIQLGNLNNKLEFFYHIKNTNLIYF